MTEPLATSSPAATPTNTPTAPLLTVNGLKKSFDGVRGQAPVTVFEHVHFQVHPGEFVCMVGHSGCGKSTILNILAGLDQPSAGHITFADGEIAGPGLERGVVFQTHALLPWFTTAGNISFAVRSRWPHISREEVQERVDRVLALVGLSDAAAKKPWQLSGGMRQRVGIARALSIEPRMLLMDEPFGALDALTRGRIQEELLRICARLGQTVFMITHDVDEALLLADRLLLMSTGPNARIAEIVINPLPRNRTRSDLHTLADYYPLRNHVVDFLIDRSDKPLPPGYDAKHPPVFTPRADATPVITTLTTPNAASAATTGAPP